MANINMTSITSVKVSKEQFMKFLDNHELPTNITEMNLENKNEEELLEMFEKYVENEYDEVEFNPVNVINNKSYWIKEFNTGDGDTIKYDFQLDKDKKSYDFCNVYFNDDLIQEVNCVNHNSYVRFRVWFKNDEVYVIKKDNPINELLEKITETDNNENIIEMTEDGVFTEYENM
jgi:hypothetical protein